MKNSSTNGPGFHFSGIYKIILIGFYAMTFYLAPVISSVSKPEEFKTGGNSNHILIALFNDNFEFGDY